MKGIDGLDRGEGVMHTIMKQLLARFQKRCRLRRHERLSTSAEMPSRDLEEIADWYEEHAPNLAAGVVLPP